MRSTRAALLALLLAMSACGSRPAIFGGNGPGGGILDAVKGPRQVAVDIRASPKLNTDRKGQALALVVRIYKLRQRAAFDSAPFDTFVNPAREQEVLGADLVEVKEITLVPGQRYQVSEKLGREIGFVGVVALFHQPAPQRWRVAFGAAEIEKAGLAIGVHGCSLSAPPSAAPAVCAGALPATVRSER